jgi:hypothetical protein
MAERLISAGVFTRENDQSFVPQGTIAAGAAVVGPTAKGPAYVPTLVTSYGDFERKFGGETDSYVPNTLRNYLQNAESALVTRVLGNGGWSFPVASRKLAAIVSGSTILTVFHPSKNDSPDSLDLSATIGSTLTKGTLNFILSGSGVSAVTVSASLDKSSPKYLTKVLGTSADNSKIGVDTYTATAFPYLNFADYQSSSLATANTAVTIVTSSANIIFTSSYSEGYDSGATPYVVSQKASDKNLFRLIHLSHGFLTNRDVKVGITNLREPADIDGVEQYSVFDVVVRQYGDTDKNPSILEQFNNVNLNPESVDYISRRIGDQYTEYNSTAGKLEVKGNYPNASEYIRVEVDPQVEAGTLSPKLSPRGFRAHSQTITGFNGLNLPPVVYKTTQTINNVANIRAYYGFDFASNDNLNYLNAIPTGANTASNGAFYIDDLTGNSSLGWNGSLSASVDLTGTTGPLPQQIQFILPFQGGTDGMNPATVKRRGEYIADDNVFGYDLETVSSTGTAAYTKALNILNNPDEYDINMLVLPGVLKSLHSAVTDKATSVVEERGDVLYIMDLAASTATINSAVNETSGLDSNYAATYFPWVKVLNNALNKPEFMPPSVLVPGAIAASDRIAAEWFAPAGLNRGGLGDALEAKIRLSQSERDQLYDARINPIATFPGTGVVIWGQKTLQARSTALDRINVRRLLINLKKYISGVSRNLVFEQNTQVTRNRFLNLVNPYLEGVQQQQGLFAFRVVMDETNNTPDVIDRNQLVGQIYLQPTRTIEYIVLDFNVTPTGATFGA